MGGFIIQPLARHEVRSVYPLIREAMPAISLSAWLDFGRRLAGRRATLSGILAARRAGRTFPCGLFCYRVGSHLANGRVLMAEHFVAVDPLDSEAVLAALVAELDGLGRQLACDAVRSVVHGADRAVASGLHAAGHAPEAAVLLKRLGRCHPTGTPSEAAVRSRRSAGPLLRPMPARCQEQ